MKKIHIAIASANIEETVKDYSKRLGCAPCLVVKGEYALWRTESMNLSVRHGTPDESGKLRHLGWEDSEVSAFTQDTDVNGILWEHFNAFNQAEEIKELWPDTDYRPDEC